MEPLERLLVTIEGSSELLRQELQKSGVSVGQFARDTDAQVGKVDSSFRKIGTTLRTTLAAFGVGFGATAIVNFTRGAIAAADAIGETAKQAGFGAERFQRLAFVFRQNGVDAAGFEGAMRALNTRLGQFLTTGAGPAAAAIKELGLQQRIASGEIQTAEQLFDAIVEALGRVDNAAKQAALQAAFFGREVGSKMAPTMAQGAEAINAAAEAATGIFTDETVAQADKLGDAMDRIGSATWNWVKALTIAGTFELGQALGIDELQPSNVDERIAQLEKLHDNLVAQNLTLSPAEAKELADLRAQVRNREHERLLRVPFIQARPPVPPAPPLTAEQRRAAQLQDITVTARRISSLADLREQARRLGFNQMPGLDFMLTGVNVTARRASSADEIVSQRRAERERLGLREFPLNEAAIARMREYADATEKARERQQRLADAIAASFESRGMEALMSGNIREGIRGFAKDLLELVIRIAILQPLAEKLAATLANIGKGKGDKKGGGKGLADILGGVLGFAGGGRPPMGRASWIGEGGAELWVPDVPGRIYSHAQSMKMAGAGGVVIQQDFHIQAGLPPQWETQLGEVARIAAGVAYGAVSERMAGRR